MGQHYALVPVTCLYQGREIRPKDPIPVFRAKSRSSAIQSLEKLAELLQAPLPDMNVYLPSWGFQGMANLLRRMIDFADELSRIACCKIVNKGPALIWGFYRRVMWDVMQESLQLEGYTPTVQRRRSMRASCTALSVARGGPTNRKDRRPHSICLQSRKA